MSQRQYLLPGNARGPNYDEYIELNLNLDLNKDYENTFLKLARETKRLLNYTIYPDSAIVRDEGIDEGIDGEENIVRDGWTTMDNRPELIALMAQCVVSSCVEGGFIVLNEPVSEMINLPNTMYNIALNYDNIKYPGFDVFKDFDRMYFKLNLLIAFRIYYTNYVSINSYEGRTTNYNLNLIQEVSDSIDADIYSYLIENFYKVNPRLINHYYDFTQLKAVRESKKFIVLYDNSRQIVSCLSDLNNNADQLEINIRNFDNLITNFLKRLPPNNLIRKNLVVKHIERASERPHYFLTMDFYEALAITERGRDIYRKVMKIPKVDGDDENITQDMLSLNNNNSDDAKKIKDTIMNVYMKVSGLKSGLFYSEVYGSMEGIEDFKETDEGKVLVAQLKDWKDSLQNYVNKVYILRSKRFNHEFIENFDDYTAEYCDGEFKVAL